MMLMLCVNDCHNGAFVDLCSSISLDDSERLTLESPYLDRHLKCEIGYDYVQLGKSKRWPHQGERDWYGNWAWHAVSVTPEVAAEILNFAIRKGYRWSMASEKLAEKIDAGLMLVAADLQD